MKPDEFGLYITPCTVKDDRRTHLTFLANNVHPGVQGWRRNGTLCVLPVHLDHGYEDDPVSCAMCMFRLVEMQRDALAWEVAQLRDAARDCTCRDGTWS